MKVIECVPNFSEGKDRSLIDKMADSVSSIEGVRLINICMDADHNRTVFTLIGNVSGIEKGAAAVCGKAVELIDMRTHSGVHPRIGAVDVVPFIPLKGAAMADAVGTAHRFGRAFAERNGVPVFFYGQAALLSERRELPEIRRGGYEGLHARMQDPQWAPDAGPLRFNHRSGGTAVGAREPLVAFNVNLASNDLQAAREIARCLRTSCGGPPCVKAIGVALKSRGIVQVSMNLTDYRKTPPLTVYKIIGEMASRRGIRILESELVGLIPEGALEGASARELQLTDFSENCILERHI